MSFTSFAPTNPYKFPKKFPGCDSPSDGGIGGNIGRKLPDVVCEERPKVYNPKTGEYNYRDLLKPIGVCYFGK